MVTGLVVGWYGRFLLGGYSHAAAYVPLAPDNSDGGMWNNVMNDKEEGTALSGLPSFIHFLVDFGVAGPYLPQYLVGTLKFAKLAYTPVTDS